MQGRQFIRIAVCAGLLSASGSALAHHSNAGFDRDNPITLTGTVTTYLFTNPHTLIGFDVKDEKGAVTHWTLEAGPPHRMYKSGWTRNSLKPGDTITVTGDPSKDGKHWIFAGSSRIKILTKQSK